MTERNNLENNKYSYRDINKKVMSISDITDLIFEKQK